MRTIAAICVLLAWPAVAETLVASRTLRAQTIVSPNDFIVAPGTVPGSATDPSEVLGLETRVVIYQGRPIRKADLGPPAIVDRNQMVMLTYQAGPLNIAAEGRALARGGIGDRIRVMNIASRTTVTGMVAEDGSVWVTADR